MSPEIPYFDKETFIKENVPPGLRAKVDPYLTDVESLLVWHEDFPHRRAHVIEALSCLDHIRWYFNELTSTGYFLALRTLEVHDKGYVFVRKGIITPEEHHFGSVLIANKIEPDPRVLYAILHHIDDTLPSNTPLWVRMARDVDRTVGMGYTGMIRLAYYMGFDHPALTEEREEEFIERGILCEDGFPEIEDYEKEAKMFFDNEVLPFLIDDDTRATEFYLRVHDIINRFMGDTRRGIEPVMKEVRDLFEIKLRHTVLAKESVWERKPLVKDLAYGDIFHYL